MFKFFDNLKEVKFFDKFFSDNKKEINNFTVKGDIIINNNDVDIPLQIKDNKLEINYNKLEKDAKIAIESSLSELAKEKGTRFIESKSYNYLTKLYDSKAKCDTALVCFFKDIIADEDYKILEAANIIIKLNPESINDQKNKLKKRYGEKGRNIVNLYNAKYFDFLKQIYNDHQKIFEEIYEQLVYEGVLTIFVSQQTDINSEGLKPPSSCVITIAFICIEGHLLAIFKPSSQVIISEGDNFLLCDFLLVLVISAKPDGLLPSFNQETKVNDTFLIVL